MATGSCSYTVSTTSGDGTYWTTSVPTVDYFGGVSAGTTMSMYCYKHGYTVHASMSLECPYCREETKRETKMKYKIGDKVRVNSNHKGNYKIGEIYTITHVSHSYDGYWDEDKGKGLGIFRDSEIELINEETKTNMLQPLTDLSNLIQRTFNEQTKTLYRAGYLTKELNVTKKLTDSLGEMFVGHIIDGSIKDATFDSFAQELVKRATEEIEEAEKKEKCCK